MIYVMGRPLQGRRISISIPGQFWRGMRSRSTRSADRDAEGVKRGGVIWMGVPSLSDYGVWGASYAPPSGSGEEPRSPANFVQNEDLKTHLVTTFCKYEHASNMYQSGIKSGAKCVVCPGSFTSTGVNFPLPCGVGACGPLFLCLLVITP